MTSDLAGGLLLVDKAGGVPSFSVVAAVRRLLDVRQVGHAGTLDPLATGLLPILVGEATKLTPFMMALDKEYEATVHLGAATDTYDSEGRVVAQGDPEVVAAVTRAAIESVLAGFLGPIRQRPPAYSAIKRNGKRLYELARAGDEVETEPRDIVIHALDVLDFTAPDLRLRVRCGKGTYIRSLAHDLGALLGTHAHLTALRRTRIGLFDVSDALVLDALPPGTRPRLLPLEQAVAHLPAIPISPEVERRVRMGQQAALESLIVPLDATGPLRLEGEDGHLVAIAEAARGMGRLQLSRVFNTAPR